MTGRVWTPEIARYWRYYVPPCRPSRFDLDVLSRVLSELRSVSMRRLRMLILGSTTEFRDLAFEEMVDSVVIDNSPEYHAAISEELTHLPRSETVLIEDWRTMVFEAEFDLVVGDLAVGQLQMDEIPEFLRRVHLAVRDGGVFVTKSFFEDRQVSRDSLPALFLHLAADFPYADPFPLAAYDITVAAVRAKDRILNFASMFEMLENIHRTGAMSEAHFRRFQEFGWDGPIKFDFTVPLRDDWESMLSTVFGNVGWEFRTADDATALPVYVARKVA